MEKTIVEMKPCKRIALIAHDGMKEDLIGWVKFNKETLSRHELVATASTGRLIERETGLNVKCYRSGPLGGDQQIGAKIVDTDIDILIFFWDPLTPQPHDPDVKALLRIAVLFNIPTASNRATADFIISSPLFCQEYKRAIENYSLRLHP
ncbi:MAG TPA: methylglyoxal synthase [Anaerolineaceae bacterium]